MEVIVGKNSGFCAGVKHTITRTEEELNKNASIDCLGEIIHNKQVIEIIIIKSDLDESSLASFCLKSVVLKIIQRLLVLIVFVVIIHM